MSEPPFFRSLICDPDRSPGWMRRPNDGGILEPLGCAHDHFAAVDFRNLYISLPGYATDVTINEILRDWAAPNLPGMTFAQKVAVARAALSLAADAGLPVAIARITQLLFAPIVPFVRVVAASPDVALWCSLSAFGSTSFTRKDPSNWDWDSQFPFGPTIEKPHRYWSIVYWKTGMPEAWGNAVPSSPGVSLGSSLTTEQGRLPRLGAERYERAGSAFWGWIYAFDGASFNPDGNNTITPGGFPDGTWHEPHVPGTSNYNRLSTARYYETRGPVLS